MLFFVKGPQALPHHWAASSISEELHASLGDSGVSWDGLSGQAGLEHTLRLAHGAPNPRMWSSRLGGPGLSDISIGRSEAGSRRLVLLSQPCHSLPG